MDLHGERELVDLRPGLVLGTPEAAAAAEVEVRTDVACYLRVRRSAEPLEDRPEAPLERLFVKELPGSPEGADCDYVLRHQELGGWSEEAFAGEFRTRHPAAARMYFENGGRTLHLVDVDFWVPPFDPADAPRGQSAEDVAERREAAAYMAFYGWAMDRIEDYGEGAINQLAIPELWTTHVHLLPQVWARIAGFCRQTGNRFLVADCAPPLKVIQHEERRRAAAEGVRLRAEELTAEALIPWYRPERWVGREDVPVEVALTLDAIDAVRALLRREDQTLSSIAVYWPWLKTVRGLDIPPCSAVCGVFARSDEENAPVGCMKPPANEPVRAVSDVSVHIDERPQNLLQREAVNLLNARAGKGIMVWGARTLCEDELWRFVNVRRLIGYIGKQLEIDNQWAVFENNTEDLRLRVSRDASYFLRELWERGALAGETPEQGFRVICNEENNPVSVREQGMLVMDVWVNPVQTNEFVHLKLTYGDATVEQA